MEDYALPRTSIPPRLYRVQYESSNTQEGAFGLTAADPNKFDYNHREFGETVEAHVHETEVDSPLISCFISKDLAEEWMCRWWVYLGEWAQILEIDTRYLGHGYVYRTAQISLELELDLLTSDNHDDVNGEFLVLHHIKSRAIVARRAKMTAPRPAVGQAGGVGSQMSTQVNDSNTHRRGSREAWIDESPRTSISASEAFGPLRGSLIHERQYGEPGSGTYASREYSSAGSMPRLTAPGRVEMTSSSSVSSTAANYGSPVFSSEHSFASDLSDTFSALTARNRHPSIQSKSSLDSEDSEDSEDTETYSDEKDGPRR